MFGAKRCANLVVIVRPPPFRSELSVRNARAVPEDQSSSEFVTIDTTTSDAYAARRLQLATEQLVEALLRLPIPRPCRDLDNDAFARPRDASGVLDDEV